MISERLLPQVPRSAENPLRPRQSPKRPRFFLPSPPAALSSPPPCPFRVHAGSNSLAALPSVAPPSLPRLFSSLLFRLSDFSLFRPLSLSWTDLSLLFQVALAMASLPNAYSSQSSHSFSRPELSSLVLLTLPPPINFNLSPSSLKGSTPSRIIPCIAAPRAFLSPSLLVFEISIFCIFTRSYSIHLSRGRSIPRLSHPAVMTPYSSFHCSDSSLD